ncbi:MAG: hypothetical protein AMJ94_07615, partial [Deltaproteobacteria bacterium SM23_61]
SQRTQRQKWLNAQRQDAGRKAALFSFPSRKIKMAKGFSGNDLCALCFLFVHPLVSIPARPKGKEEPMSVK